LQEDQYMKLKRYALPWFLTGLALVLIVSACGDDDGGDNGSGDTPTPSSSVIVSTSTVFPDEGFQFEINEVGLGEDGWVALNNYTDQPASMKGLFLCQPPVCVELPDVEVAAETTAIVALGNGDDLQGVVATDADLALAPPNGELALFAGDDAGDSSKIRSYLEWGSEPHEATDVAIEAGLWIEGSYAPTSDSATRLFRSDEGLWLFE
jgi:hypothetical protein